MSEYASAQPCSPTARRGRDQLSRRWPGKPMGAAGFPLLIHGGISRSTCFVMSKVSFKSWSWRTRTTASELGPRWANSNCRAMRAENVGNKNRLAQRTRGAAAQKARRQEQMQVLKPAAARLVSGGRSESNRRKF